MLLFSIAKIASLYCFANANNSFPNKNVSICPLYSATCSSVSTFNTWAAEKSSPVAVAQSADTM